VADLPTPAELAERGRGVYRTAIDPNGTGAVNLHAGSRNDAMLSVFTGVGARLLAYAVARFSAARLATAVDDDLDVIGQDLFGLPRKQASAAVGSVYLQRGSGGDPSSSPRARASPSRPVRSSRCRPRPARSCSKPPKTFSSRAAC
jgi:hypothetical protein